MLSILLLTAARTIERLFLIGEVMQPKIWKHNILKTWSEVLCLLKEASKGLEIVRKTKKLSTKRPSHSSCDENSNPVCPNWLKKRSITSDQIDNEEMWFEFKLREWVRNIWFCFIPILSLVSLVQQSSMDSDFEITFVSCLGSAEWPLPQRSEHYGAELAQYIFLKASRNNCSCLIRPTCSEVTFNDRQNFMSW